MKNDYFERKENRIEKFKELAAKNEKLQEDSFKRSDEMASVIPFGQPILVGHHSEKRDRNYRKRIHGLMDKGVEAGQKAKYYENRAEAAEGNRMISSDNPNAVTELEKKLADMQELQEMYKALNKIIKSKKLTEEQKTAALEAKGWGGFAKLIGPDFCGRIGIPSYKLTNNNANMARVKQRIEQLKKIETMEEKRIEIGLVSILSSPDTNRVQIFFPGKPDEKVRTELKRSGFKWAPSEGAWQKMLSSYAESQAYEIVTRFYS